MKIEETWIECEKCLSNCQVLFKRVPPGRINHFVSSSVSPEDFRLLSDRPVQEVIVAEDGQLITRRESARLTVRNGEVLPDPEIDILKIAVVNRYQKKRPAVGFIKNFGFKIGRAHV